MAALSGWPPATLPGRHGLSLLGTNKRLEGSILEPDRASLFLSVPVPHPLQASVVKPFASSRWRCCSCAPWHAHKQPVDSRKAIFFHVLPAASSPFPLGKKWTQGNELHREMPGGRDSWGSIAFERGAIHRSRHQTGGTLPSLSLTLSRWGHAWQAMHCLVVCEHAVLGGGGKCAEAQREKMLGLDGPSVTSQAPSLETVGVPCLWWPLNQGMEFSVQIRQG